MTPMAIGSEMNHSHLSQTVVHLLGAIPYGTEWVVQIPMVMDIQTQVTEHPVKG